MKKLRRRFEAVPISQIPAAALKSSYDPEMKIEQDKDDSTKPVKEQSRSHAS